MLHLFSDEYKNMKLRIPGKLTVHMKTLKIIIVAASFFLALLALAVIGCGIPSYPYLYPPEALGGGVVGFSHDENNDPDVFRGYEIFYRFYSVDPDTADIRQAEIDMQNYFNGIGAIRSIVYGTSSSAFTFGFRRLIIEGTTEADTTAPLLSVDIADRNNSFTIEFFEYELNNVIELNYGSVSYEVFRYVPYTESVEYDYKPFLPIDDEELYNFAAGESDIHDNVSEEITTNNNASLYVAFFAVPYGFDAEAVQELYANGSYEGMEYIGSFELQ